MIRDDALRRIALALAAGERLSFEDGLALYGTRDLLGLGALAHEARSRRHARRTFFVQSRRMSYTNVCVTACPFCAFQVPPGGPGAYTLTPEAAVRELEASGSQDLRELHMTAGHNPELDITYFEALFGALRARFPRLHLKVFTMVELDYYARNSGLTVEAFLDRCRAAGLESCPGGGAEIFDEALRARLCPGKADAATWLGIAETCHRKGISTNATMLYGHLEEPRHKVDHLLRLRALQDRTGGFLAFIPLAYQPGATPLARAHGLQGATAVEDLREIAVARLLLDNVPHIKAYWVMIGLGVAQVALSFGADDLDGTLVREEVAHAAGADTPAGLTRDHLERLIREAGFEPVERDHLYRTVLRPEAYPRSTSGCSLDTGRG